VDFDSRFLKFDVGPPCPVAVRTARNRKSKIKNQRSKVDSYSSGTARTCRCL
jgi:hypothetical protein